MVTKRHMIVNEEVRSLVMTQCKQEFLRHHPEMKGMRITQDFMIRKIAEFYLK